MCLSSPRSLVSAIYEGLYKTHTSDDQKQKQKFVFITGEINK